MNNNTQFWIMSDSEDESVERQLKIVIVGDSSTGKYFPTAGVDFFLKKTLLPGGRNITLQIWDIGGQALSGNMLDKYVFGANVVMLTYEITNITSFTNLEKWLQAIYKATEMQEQKPSVALVANKSLHCNISLSDLEHQRGVRLDKHQKFAQERGFSAYLVSARTGENVALSFQKVVAEVLGLKLTRAEQEEQQPVMKAEIVHKEAAEDSPASSSQLGASKSSVCVMQ
uniref:Ras-related protein Rab-28 n=1 Tax=Timema genevievae TaxID=629358 RepID=A0A7R9PQA6_TIMGE|nr:unnamed protein product [Timema genevievae]